MSPAAIGVQRPAIKNSPRPIASTSNTVEPIDGPPTRNRTASSMSTTPATTRKSNRPTPGGPWAKVENNRRTIPEGYGLTAPRGDPQKGDFQDSFERSELD